MPAERPRPHELMVAHDERHSYMQRMHTLAGPGAYSVPSTFQRPAPNLLLRVVQRESYGRDFARHKRALTSAGAAESPLDAPCQLCLVTAADTHRARRDSLRKLLQLERPADRWCQDGSTSPRSVAADSRRAGSPDDRARQSPNSRASSPSRQRWASADLADIVADFGEPRAAIEAEHPSEDDNATRAQQQLCLFRPPLSFQHFLMSTSYLERLKKQQQRQRAASLP